MAAPALAHPATPTPPHAHAHARRCIRRKKKKKKRDPAAPKHPLSAYIFFTQDYRERVKVEIGSEDVTKVARQLGLLWKDMDQDTRRPYQDKADLDKIR